MDKGVMCEAAYTFSQHTSTSTNNTVDVREYSIFPHEVKLTSTKPERIWKEAAVDQCEALTLNLTAGTGEYMKDLSLI
jgi:hypothetical protein